MPNSSRLTFFYHTTNGEVKPRHLSSRRLASFEDVDVGLILGGKVHNPIAIKTVG